MRKDAGGQASCATSRSGSPADLLLPLLSVTRAAPVVRISATSSCLPLPHDSRAAAMAAGSVGSTLREKRPTLAGDALSRRDIHATAIPMTRQSSLALHASLRSLKCEHPIS